MTSQEEIIETVLGLFKANGIKSVGVDRIANELGISKRTLYDVVESKDKLVEMCLKSFKEDCHTKLDAICKRGDQVFERILALMDMQVSLLRSMSPAFIEEVMPRRKQGMKKQEELDKHYAFFQSLIKEGQTGRDGNPPQINPSLNAEIITKLMSEVLKVIAEGTEFDYTVISFFEVYRTVWYTYLRGISTEYGAKTLEEWYRTGK